MRATFPYPDHALLLSVVVLALQSLWVQAAAITLIIRTGEPSEATGLASTN
jgi:hypothetical protein